jgi:hypothetical protein
MNVQQICNQDCTHKRCAKVQQIALSECAKCGHEIEFDTPYIEAPNGTVFHSACITKQEAPCQH